ncbi:uncharacterized protein LOC135103823 [Scylla paramamosain]|uniref:uncharacterized protein LOC135103823 n=1 Tax=Scylla paramamosain TaxID=85552 RepID=UPI0030834C1F
MVLSMRRTMSYVTGSAGGVCREGDACAVVGRWTRGGGPAAGDVADLGKEGVNACWLSSPPEGTCDLLEVQSGCGGWSQLRCPASSCVQRGQNNVSIEDNDGKVTAVHQQYTPGPPVSRLELRGISQDVN